jgi:hypothetical protein
MMPQSFSWYRYNKADFDGKGLATENGGESSTIQNGSSRRDRLMPIVTWQLFLGGHWPIEAGWESSPEKSAAFDLLSFCDFRFSYSPEKASAFALLAFRVE